MTPSLLCYCQSNRAFSKCCSPFLNNTSLPKTPEQLMRSRYSAFVTYNVDYLEETMLAPALTLFNKLETLNWTMSVRWKGLNVLSSTATHDTGYVSFIAYYEENNGTHHISEASTFKKKNGKWFYVSGISLDG